MKKIMEKALKIWNRISNTKSLLAIVSALMIITNNLGLQIDNQVVMNIVNAILTILVIIGVVNSDGMDTTKWNK
jgi:uncharacterized membrane protein